MDHLTDWRKATEWETFAPRTDGATEQPGMFVMDPTPRTPPATPVPPIDPDQTTIFDHLNPED